MDLAQLHENIVETYLIYRDQRLNFSFKPDLYDDRVHRLFSKFAGRDWAEGDKILEKLLHSWDLTHRGQAVPISVATFGAKGFPVPLKQAIFLKIMQEVMSPNSDGSSSDTSPSEDGAAQPSTSSFE